MDSITKDNNKEHNEKGSYIPDHPHRILVIGGSGSGKTNVLLNLIKEKDDMIWWHDCRHYESQKISSHNQRIVY